jgi:sulfite oxidase
MRERVADVQGIDWGDGAVMNAVWGGVPLREVLLSAGIKVPSSSMQSAEDSYQGLHVQFTSAQETQDDTYYGASVPLSTALDPERQCLLATHMNGELLTAKHGYPLRVIIPGIIGARSVKWLDSIIVSGEESKNHYQQRDYKVLSGEIAERIEAAEGEEEKGRIKEEAEPLMDNPINSVVAVPGKDGDILRRDDHGRVYVRGYAIPQGKDGPVVRVEVSIDRGGTWHEASILDEGDENTARSSTMGKKGETLQRGQFAWVLWECRVPVDGDPPREDISIWSKATDKGGNTMDVEKPEGEWNMRGVGFNAVEGRRGIRIE